MNKAKNPNFNIGLISFALLIAGVILRANRSTASDYVLGASFILGAIHWVWSIIDVLKYYKIKSPSENRILWLILVVAIPPVGGMLFYGTNKALPK
jgi:membrane-associated phospholipid phosphatase